MTEIARHHAALAAAVDNDDDQAFAVAPTISFDDMSAREDFLLMLVSTASGSVMQRKNQKRALTILQGCGIQPEILDAADKSNALVRDELCEMSGMRGRYPQFFLVQGDQTQFFADYEELETMNEEGTLRDWLRMEIPCPSPARPSKSESPASSPPSAEKEQPKQPSFAFEETDKQQQQSDEDDDVTAETHPETSHASSSWDSYSAAQRQQHQLESFDSEQYEDSCRGTLTQDEEDEATMYAASDFSDATDHQGFPLSPPRMESQANVHSEQERNKSPLKSPQAESSVLPTSFTQRSPEQWETKDEEEENSIYDNAQEDPQHSPHFQLEDQQHANDLNADNLHSLNSLLSGDDDETVDTTATASSIVTNSRMTSMNLDLAIQPATDLHFQLTHGSEDSSKCTVTLSNTSSSYLPLAFRIQASQRSRYMVWPSVGVVKPQSTMSITVFLMDGAKQELLDSFEKFGPAAEFRCIDTLSIEWCGVPTDFCNQLTDDHDQDLETLMSYWHSCHKDEAWTCEQSNLRVRVSVDDKNKQHCNGIPQVRSPPRLQKETVPSQVSVDESATHPLQAEVDNLRRKCEELTAERYILEQQLEESREREAMNNGSAIHRLQLQQTMRCGHCLKVFQSDPRSMLAPIASQSCGHSICRNCCYQRSSRSKRRVRQSISSDLLMCVGDLQATTSFDDDSCPICQAPSAFGSSKLHVNQSLCLVLKLLDNN